MSTTPFAIRQAVYSALTGGTALSSLVGSRVYHRVAPDAAAYPLVVFNLQGDAVEQLALGGADAYLDAPYLVRAIADTQAGAEAAYAAAHDAMTTPGAVAAAGVTVIATTRTSVVDYQEGVPSDGAVIHHVGGVYRVLARE